MLWCSCQAGREVRSRRVEVRSRRAKVSRGVEQMCRGEVQGRGGAVQACGGEKQVCGGVKQTCGGEVQVCGGVVCPAWSGMHCTTVERSRPGVPLLHPSTQTPAHRKPALPSESYKQAKRQGCPSEAMHTCVCVHMCVRAAGPPTLYR
eukprot:365016-Chlamydomonas_euryale.AAC.6